MTRLVEVCFSTLPFSLGQKFWSGSLMYFLSMHLFITVIQSAGKRSLITAQYLVCKETFLKQ